MSEVTYPKSGTLDPGLLVGPQTETRDVKGGTQDTRPGTQAIGETWKQRHGTLKVGPET